MATSSSRKRPRPDDEFTEKDPIIFALSGLKPDCLLHVLNQPFHCHSTILHLHSAYFRKFLDSADKPERPVSASFQYEYISMVDDDGSWALIHASKAPALTTEKLSLVQALGTETELWRKLLCAMYNKRYTIEHAIELGRLIDLADYYCALPIISATIVGALAISSLFSRAASREFGKQAPWLFPKVRKLRNCVLFKEVIVHIIDLSSRAEPEGEEWVLIRDDPQIGPLLARESLRINQLVMEIDKHIMCASFQGDRCLKERPGPETDYSEENMDVFGTANPEFYREVKIAATPTRFNPGNESLEGKLRQLLTNNLVLDRTHHEVGDFSSCHSFGNEYSLCGWIGDHEMPWDDAEDW